MTPECQQDKELMTGHKCELSPVRKKGFNLELSHSTPIQVQSDDDTTKTRRMRNAEAARKCREKKKERDLARLQELQDQLVKQESVSKKLKKDYESVLAEKSKWILKENLFNKLVIKLRSEVQKQKEYIVKLEGSIMAYKMSGRVQPSPIHNISGLSSMGMQRMHGTNAMSLNASIPMIPKNAITDIYTNYHTRMSATIPHGISGMTDTQDINHIGYSTMDLDERDITDAAMDFDPLHDTSMNDMSI